MNIKEIQVKDQAKRALDFANSGGFKKGGFEITHKLNCYGIALKYIFFLRDLTYADVAYRLKVTPQSVNNIVNRMKKDKFNSFYIDKLCDNLGIDVLYFKDLVQEIDNILEA